MNLQQFKTALNNMANQIGLDIKAINDWKSTLINDASIALDKVWSSKKVSDEFDKKVDKVAGKGLSDENYTTAEKTKLAGLESSKFKGLYPNLAALKVDYPEGAGESWSNGEGGWYADVDAGTGSDTIRYVWDKSDDKWVSGGSGSPLTPAQIKSMYESNPDTNAFTDSDKNKLDNIEAGAQVNTITGVKGSAEATYRIGDVSIGMVDIDAGTTDPMVTYTTARDS